MSLNDLTKAEKRIKRDQTKTVRPLIIAAAILIIGLIVAAVFGVSLPNAEPIVPQAYREIHLCDYCNASHRVSIYALDPDIPIHGNILYSNGELARKLCMDCFIKVFDTALGEPKYKEAQ